MVKSVELVLAFMRLEHYGQFQMDEYTILFYSGINKLDISTDIMSLML